MTSEKHYSPYIHAQLNTLLRHDDFCGKLPGWLASLSHSSFRTAGYVIGERMAPELSPERFWELFQALVEFNAKAFLVTMLKALILRLEEKSVTLHDAGFQTLALQIATNEVDRRKTLHHLLPHIESPDEMRQLFLSLRLTDEEDWIPFLMDCPTLPSFYLLFLALRRRDHEHSFILKMAAHLMKRGDSLSFNMASLMKSYFGLDELRGTFSLTLKPYELSSIELSFPIFCQKMSF